MDEGVDLATNKLLVYTSQIVSRNNLEDLNDIARDYVLKE